MSTEATLNPTLPQPVFETKNTIEQSERSSLVKTLNQALADAIDLQLQTKMAHWNVRGPNFLPLHELFDDVNARAREFSDLIAERIGQLGGLVEGNLQAVAARSRLDIYPIDRMRESEHTERVAASLAAFATAGRETVETASEMGDEVTADIFTEVTRSTEKLLWFVEAHFQG
jgi:starvation-inducible DNA-binding protein